MSGCSVHQSIGHRDGFGYILQLAKYPASVLDVPAHQIYRTTARECADRIACRIRQRLYQRGGHGLAGKGGGAALQIGIPVVTRGVDRQEGLRDHSAEFGRQPPAEARLATGDHVGAVAATGGIEQRQFDPAANLQTGDGGIAMRTAIIEPAATIACGGHQPCQQCLLRIDQRFAGCHFHRAARRIGRREQFFGIERQQEVEYRGLTRGDRIAGSDQRREAFLVTWLQQWQDIRHDPDQRLADIGRVAARRDREQVADKRKLGEEIGHQLVEHHQIALELLDLSVTCRTCAGGEAVRADSIDFGKLVLDRAICRQIHSLA